MRLKYIFSKREINKFINFSKVVYGNDPFFRDSMSDIERIFLTGGTAFLNHAEIHPFWVEEDKEIFARAAYIIDYHQKDMLMVSFFEARPGAQTAVDLIIKEAKNLAIQKGLKRIVFGLDGHLNYGLGFLASHFQATPAFGFSYNPSYYLNYFTGLKEYNFTSFLVDISRFNMEKEGSILKRIKKQGFTFRFADLSNLDREIEIYTKLNNLCFSQHLWWTDRTVLEDKELFYPFRWFLKGENLIFAEKDGEPIGMMLWYPDFNQLLSPGTGLGVNALIKYKLGLGKINKFKIAEIAIIEKYQGTGAVLGLFELLYSVVKDKYKFCEAGWIEENNLKSWGLGIRWLDYGCKEYKKYKAFEVVL